jgi:site-specific DNA-adenine methylase
MLMTPLKCPHNFVSLGYLKENLSRDTPIDCFAFRDGSIEIGLMADNFKITAFTNLYHVWEFWRCLLNSPETLLSNIEFFHKNIKDNELAHYRQKWFVQLTDPYQRASVFYLLNRYSQNGLFSQTEVTKHNFSKLNILSFERFAPIVKNLNLVFDNQNDFTDSFRHLKKDHVLFLPIGKRINKLLKFKNIRSPETFYFNEDKIFKHLEGNEQKVILLYKYDTSIDKFNFNKTYINKFGFRTENTDLAEDVIITNFDL